MSNLNKPIINESEVKTMENQTKEVQKALCDFIIRTTKFNAPSHAVQALPEAIRVLIELTKFNRTQKPF